MMVTVVISLFRVIPTFAVVVDRVTRKTSSASGSESSFVAIIIFSSVLLGQKCKPSGGLASTSALLAVRSETVALKCNNITMRLLVKQHEGEFMPNRDVLMCFGSTSSLTYTAEISSFSRPDTSIVSTTKFPSSIVRLTSLRKPNVGKATKESKKRTNEMYFVNL